VTALYRASTAHLWVGARYLRRWLFEVLRQFYGDDIAFTFTPDEFKRRARGRDGQVRPEQSRHCTSLSQAEEENGQSRVYLGIH
jgi:hypothetical protein